MKKNIKPDDGVITRGILKQELKSVRAEFKRGQTKLRDELHFVEYRLETKMDSRFNEILDHMKKHTDTFQKLADQVIGAHKNFEVESVSIHHNYNHLETRVKKVEEVVFPGQAG
ncbi:MAG: hypothetical protein AAB558_02500 [Patescibacteria group bacterium]